MRVLYLAGRERSYARVSIIRKGLLRNGVALVDGTSESPSVLRRAIDTLLAFLRTPSDRYDIILISFFGQPFVPLLRLFTRKPIILDAFMSVYNTAVEDKRLFAEGSFGARCATWLDRRSTSDANLVLFDTEEHIQYFCTRYSVSREKFARLLIGTDDEIFYPREEKPVTQHVFTVLFYGGFIPLQGVEYIIRAADILRNEENIRFRIIGRGQTYPACRRLADSLRLDRVEFLDAVPPERVPYEIQQADLGLGIFGDTRKTQMVIPNKVYEIAGMMKPVISADTPAMRELFAHKENIYFCKHADPVSLADAIDMLRNDPRLRTTIATGGYELIQRHGTPKVIGETLVTLAKGLLSA